MPCMPLAAHAVLSMRWLSHRFSLEGGPLTFYGCCCEAWKMLGAAARRPPPSPARLRSPRGATGFARAPLVLAAPLGLRLPAPCRAFTCN